VPLLRYRHAGANHVLAHTHSWPQSMSVLLLLLQLLPVLLLQLPLVLSRQRRGISGSRPPHVRCSVRVRRVGGGSSSGCSCGGRGHREAAWPSQHARHCTAARCAESCSGGGRGSSSGCGQGRRGRGARSRTTSRRRCCSHCSSHCSSVRDLSLLVLQQQRLLHRRLAGGN
jgi:hypothetical protein